jgi:hypothetical protein
MCETVFLVYIMRNFKYISVLILCSVFIFRLKVVLLFIGTSALHIPKTRANNYKANSSATSTADKNVYEEFCLLKYNAV